MTITPAQPPVLPQSVAPVGRPPVLVTGAETPLGRAVVRELEASRVRAVAFSQTPGLKGLSPHVTGDITTGAGLDVALRGVGAVIHCASDPRRPERVDLAGTRQVLSAVDAWAPGAHVVLPSAVGCWENPWRAYRAKADAENLLLGWGGPASIVRSTPLHPSVRRLVSGRAAYLTGASSSFAVAPVDPAWVAGKLVDVALVRQPLAVPLEVSGPEILTLGDLATLTAHVEGRRPRRFLAVPRIGGTLRAFAAGANLPSDEAQTGGVTYGRWLLETSSAAA